MGDLLRHRHVRVAAVPAARSGWVALFYYVAGVALLWIARGPEPLHGWWVGGTFGVGQLLAALVLYWNLEASGMVAWTSAT